MFYIYSCDCIETNIKINLNFYVRTDVRKTTHNIKTHNWKTAFRMNRNVIEFLPMLNAFGMTYPNIQLIRLKLPRESQNLKPQNLELQVQYTSPIENLYHIVVI